MYRLLILGLLLCCNQFTFAQGPETVRRKDPDNWEFVQMRQGNVVISEGNMHDGIQEGAWTYFWENGLPHHVITYKRGVKDGTCFDITRVGQIEVVENYRNGKLEGPRRVFAGGGKLLDETYYAEGKKSGVSIKNYADGVQKQEEGMFQNDVRDGKTTWYYPNGQKAADYSYSNGLLDGDVALYHDNGRVSEFGLYQMNNQTGIWKEYYPDGTPKAEGNYKNGEKDGTWKEWDEAGKERSSTYRKGKEMKAKKKG